MDESSSDEDNHESKSSRHPSKSSKNPQDRTYRMNPTQREDSDGDDDDDDDDEDEDDIAALKEELARIKKERAAEAARIEEQKRIEEEKIRTENILRGNPLLNPASKTQTAATEFRVKRRWDDDVVFKNCAKGDGSGGEKRLAQFVNDSLRSEFHRRFMDKYIK